MVNGLAGPERSHQGEALVEPVPALDRAARVAEGLEVGRSAEADAEDEPAAREPVDPRRLVRELPRQATRGRRDHRPQHEPRAFGHDGQDRPGIDAAHGAIRERDEVVVDEEPVPLALLRQDGDVDQRPGLAEEAEVRAIDTEAHGRHLLRTHRT